MIGSDLTNTLGGIDLTNNGATVAGDDPPSGGGGGWAHPASHFGLSPLSPIHGIR